MIALFAQHAGAHVAHAAPFALLPQIFRRLAPARWRRKPAALGTEGTWSSPQEPGAATAYADAMHATYAPLADAQQHRPVNGIYLGTMPRLTTPDRPPWDIPTAAFPVYGTAPVATVLAAEEGR
jgi:hypothetical protein